MILVDYSAIAIASITVDLNARKGVHLEDDLLRHMIINTIRSYNLKFKAEYGDMVIACDGRNYWRKDYFPYYKANRSKNREESGMDWETIFRVMKELREDLHEFFPYKVIHLEKTEADDVIGVLADWSQTNDLKQSLFDETPKPLLILSGDGDFMQLQKYSNVRQYSPTLKRFMQTKNPEEFLFDHIIRGDFGDGVPNVLSQDDCLVKGERQKPIFAKKVSEWINKIPTDVEFQRNFQRNQTLVDLSKIPQVIRDRIIETFESLPTKDRSMLIPYFMKHKMKNMMNVVQDF